LREWFDFRDPSSAGVIAEMSRATAAGGVVSINHPRPWGPDWEYDDVDANQSVEVWNGPWENLNGVCVAFWEDQLQSGRHVVAVGGSDTHELRTPGSGTLDTPKLAEPTTWIYVGERLDQSTLLAGLKAGRVFVSATPHGPQIYSDRVGENLSIRVVGGRNAMLNIVAAASIDDSRRIDADDWRATIPFPAGVSYVRAEVVNDSGLTLAFANPHWSNVSSQT
jgi:hypothetical protein